ncbi:MAG: Lrp/AsnC family transcriptional regulator [Candidatus Bathyarchaeota archaeon]|nr:Lrp/AsnC family transcriptional regulator [Candidatus Bathyarchaeota archaeon]
MVQNSDLDTEILKLLQTDSRLSYREIAKQLNVSHVNVSNRIKVLEEQGKIRGYTVVLDPDSLGYYPLCLRISAESGCDFSEIGKKVAEHESINVVMRVTGDCELLALAMCPDKQSALELLDKINAIPGIEKAESHIVLESIKLSGKQLKP